MNRARNLAFPSWRVFLESRDSHLLVATENVLLGS
jgi:hypothetical protein